jgi:thiol peroxidase
VVLDASDRVVYTQQVPEISSEPDYAAALEAARKAKAGA